MPTQYKNPAIEGELLPTLQEIIAVKKPAGVPKEAAWIWGPEDEVGRLNLLTAEHVRQVLSTEPLHGIVASLNWDLSLPRQPSFGRQACESSIFQLPDMLVNDDVLHLNTQSGSQLDGFRHIGHQGCGTFYNGLTQEEILGPQKSFRCGMQACSKRGIVGRGVLLDFVAFAVHKGIEYDPFTTYPISLSQLLEIAAWEGVEFHCGDILLVRTGWIQRYNACLESDCQDDLRRATAEHPRAIGVDQSDEVKAWIHDQYFALVGGDQPSFEAWPSPSTPILHEYLLACWGIMIGEMLDLEDLSQKCRQAQKYSFVFTSAPLNSSGGVATPANALCIL